MKKHLLLGLTVLSLGVTSIPVASANTALMNDEPTAKASNVAYVIVRNRYKRPLCYDPWSDTYYYCGARTYYYNSYPYDYYNYGGPGVTLYFGGGGHHHHHH